MSDGIDGEPGALPSIDVTWLAAMALPARDAPEADLARMRLAAALFPDTREPVRVGRYVVLQRIGAGGMGIVYAAYDPELDRKVAIKLMHAFDGESQAALLNEARTLAKLSHPHVVSVHDVGTFQLPGDSRELMFVAMEFVEGRTLSAWLKEQPRSQREIVDLLLEAGRGLVAAHAVGVVHLDFKPDNVLVDRDGHAHVVDFGLARARPVGPPTALSDTGEVSGPIRETDTKLYAGTPAYMAPERIAGTASDARSDQFSFGVTLWEALYGERPFTGTSLLELAANILAGARRPAPRGTRLPRWLRGAMQRAMAVEAADRWPSLADLLDALARGRARSRRLAALAVVGAIGLVGATSLGVQHIDEQRRVAACEDEGAVVDSVWNDEQRDAVRSALLATGATHAITTAQKLMPWLDRQADAWRQARTEACLDATVRGTTSTALDERSVWCLEDRRLELDALVTELRKADVDQLGRAVQAAADLRDVAPCRDAPFLERWPEPPTEDADEIFAIRSELARVDALEATGAYARALAVARDIVSRAEVLGWPPLVARSRVLEGQLLELTGAYEDAATALESGYFYAATAGLDDDALTAAQSLVNVIGRRLARPAEGEHWFKLAGVLLTRVPDPLGSREIDGLNSLALVREVAGDYAGAVELYERALVIEKQANGPDHLRVAGLENNLAIVRGQMSALDEATTLAQDALRIREQTLGADHPDVGRSLCVLAFMRHKAGDWTEAEALQDRGVQVLERSLGHDHASVALGLGERAVMHKRRGEYEKAMPLYARVLAIQERTFGPDHPDVARTLHNMANVLSATQQHERAAALLERAATIFEQKLGPDHAAVGDTLGNLANVRTAMGAYAEAVHLHERSISIAEKAFGPDHDSVARKVGNLAAVRYSMGELAEAKRLGERALASGERAFGPEHPNLANPLVVLASVALSEDRAADAVVLAERAAKIRDAGEFPVDQRAQAHFLLARSLAAAGGSDARALELARRAYEEHRGAEPPDRKALDEVEAWLRKHGDAR